MPLEQSAIIHCLVVDDQPSSREILGQFIERTPGIKLCLSVSEGLAAFDYLKMHPEVNLIFLDVEMPSLDGFDLLKMIEQHHSHVLPLVILTTGHAHYAIDGYHIDRVVGFLHKVVTYRNFLLMIQKVQRLLPQYQREAGGKVSPNMKSFFIKVCYNKKEKFVQVNYNDLIFVQSQRNYVTLTTLANNYIVRKSLTEILALLHYSSFVQVHRSYVINMHHIQQMTLSSITLTPNYQIPLSAGYRSSVMQEISTRLISDD